MHPVSRTFTVSAITLQEFYMLNRIMLQGALVASLVAASAMSVSAQSVVATEPAVTTTSVAVTPVVNEGARAVRSGVSLQEATTTQAPQLMQGGDRRNVSWMVVGLAAIGVGVLIGGDVGTVVALGGGIVGLVGLFRYMN